ncbi:NAD(P)-binding protein [Exidia glandulosa HHB12029]|uniref:NAD(P)-binding protein n=1 Tax=Exidia glandulosa HHB12029 TaxID=1314781 RepID=A0A165BA65_EXIGL|nr:NAD(P)-binding protein [Exidia glandulosa HHB12029]
MPLQYESSLSRSLCLKPMTDTRETVLITGCTPGGIGHALALEFHKQGARVFATARRIATLEDLRAQGIETLSIDVGDDDSVQAAAARYRELTGGKLDILVNNAGRGYTTSVTDAEISEVTDLFNANVIGVVRMVRAFGPFVIAAKGKIVNNGSIAGTIAMPFRGTYGATKAAMHAMGDALRLEMKPFGVQVITLKTGAILSTGVNNDLVKTNSPHSIYASIYPAVDQTTSAGAKDAMPTAQYAKRVVSTVLKPHPPAVYWYGKAAGFTWFLVTFVPRSISDSIMSRVWSLTALSKELRKRRE